MSDSYPRQSARTRRFTLGAPRDLRVAHDGSRVLFLRSASGDDPVNRLWCLDLDDTSSGTRATERCIADPHEVLTRGTDVEETAAERARRERAREAAGGIVGYDADGACRTAVFVLGGRLFRTDVARGATHELAIGGAAFDARLDPTGTRVAYVSGRGLRVVDDAGDRVVIAPSAASGDGDEVTWGSAEFVAAEEMHRTRGYWWGPGGRHLLVERVDNAPVATWWISSPVDPFAEPHAVRYPKAGTDNAHVALAVVGLDGSRVDVDWARGEFEYLCDASWAPRARPTLVVQTRDQRTVAVLDVDPATGATTELHRQYDTAWVELVPGAPAWVGDRLLTVEDREDTRRVCIAGEPVTPVGVQVRRVIDVVGDDVYVAATTEPTEVHVARCGADGDFRWLTEAPGVHGAAFGGTRRVDTFTTIGVPGRVLVRTSSDPVEITSYAETPVVDPRPELHVVGDRELRVALLLPAEPPPDVKIPVILDPYGGPHALRVQKAATAFATSQWFADQGFAVIVCDGRGTPARGAAWERSVRGDLATPALEDQVTALDEICSRHPQLDRSRVGIRGWSFGGYLAALAVLRRPDVFHAAVAGAPVTEWGLYDTHYTERYLGDPRVEPANYERSDLTPLAERLERPLLLVHGMADDNVVVAHTLRLSRALLEAGRAHRVVPLSGVTHMTPQETVAANLLALEIDFFREALRVDPPEPAYKWRPMLPRRGRDI